MTHIDLFSGIGGFALAADYVFGEVEHTFVEIDPFCQAVLKKHWPESEIHGDIKTFTNTSSDRLAGGGAPATIEEGREPRSEQSGELARRSKRPHSLLTGGFPCQPFSAAGRRQGTADNRYLWPEMFRVIREFQPQWVIAENVGGLVTWNEGLVLEQVCTDLESENYEVQPLIIPAASVNAPHRRDRVWIIAHRSEQGWSGNGIEGAGRSGFSGGVRQDKDQNSDAQNPDLKRSRGRMESDRQILGSERPEAEDARSSWSKNWIEVAAELCSVDDGLPIELGELKLSKAGHRKEQLKAYGNAIVPQVAVEIMKVLKGVRV